MNEKNIISLHGSWREMGRQYGELADPFLKDVLQYIETMTKGSKEKMDNAIDLAEKLIAHYPDYLKDFFHGMEETSSLTPLQLKLCNAVEYIEPCFFCSALVAWDDYAKDHLVFGRNYDAVSYSEIARDIVVTIYHPDNALAFATIGYAGEIYCINGFNECGIFVELNNGMPSAGDTIHWDLCPSTSNLFDLISKARTMDDVENFFNTTQSFASFIITTANAQEARRYEWCYDGVKRGDTLLPHGLVVSTNHYINNEWEYPVPTDEKSWNSISRHNNLMERASEYKGKIDTDLMKQIMSTPIPSGGPWHEFTRYQIIVEPAKRQLHIKTGNDPWRLVNPF